jgi:hypothetical protein
MELREIAAITGKGGLFKILQPTRSGVIVETLDDKKQRLVISAHQRVSVLKEISIYTQTAEGSVPLEEVLVTIKKEFDDDPGVDKNSSPEELRAFLKHILPDFDENRVYPSDIKKLVSWYEILYKAAPETLEPAKNDTKAENQEKPKAAAKPKPEKKSDSSAKVKAGKETAKKAAPKKAAGATKRGSK